MNDKKAKKTKKEQPLSENDENRLSACDEFAFELSDMLRVYISPKKLRKITRKLWDFLEEETRRYESFKKRYPGRSEDGTNNSLATS